MAKLLKHDLPLRAIKLLNVVLMTAPFVLCWYRYYSERMFMMQFGWKGNLLVFTLFLILYLIFGRVYDAFYISHSKVSEMVFSQLLAAVFTDSIMYIVICLLIRKITNVVPMLVCFAVQTVVSYVWSVLSQKWYFCAFKPKRTAIFYDMRENMSELIAAYEMKAKFDVIVNCHVDECLENGFSVIEDNDIEVVYLCGVHSHDRNIVLKYCVAHGISVYVIPRIGDVLMSGAKKMRMFHLPILRVDGYKPGFEYLFAKRLFDIAASLAALVITSPIMIITAVAIKSEDGGPVFYKQCRLTRGGKRYNVIKFRSMGTDAEKDGVARLSTGMNDDRITKVGRIIRRSHVDELPQFFCTLIGSMSIVGPRPERPEIAEQYERKMPEFALRLQAKAGLTGLAQVYGKYNTTPYDKLQMDLMYIANPSILEDIKICFATVKILFMPDNTEGIAVGQTTAVVEGIDPSKSSEKEIAESKI